MKKLRGKNGCPWDKKQTHQSISRYLLEEAYEAFGAIKDKRWKELKEELGDLLFQVIFQAHLAEEENRFNLSDILHSIQKKLITRHPHVFGTEKARTAEEQTQKWDEYKAKETQKNLLERVPKTMPALMQSFLLQERAHRAGFKWNHINGVKEKFDEELEEWKKAIQSGNKKEMEEELGDLLFVLTHLAGWLDLNAEEALLAANKKFLRRFGQLEKLLRENKRSFKECSAEELDSYWNQVKKKERR